MRRNPFPEASPARYAVLARELRDAMDRYAPPTEVGEYVRDHFHRGGRVWFDLDRLTQRVAQVHPPVRGMQGWISSYVANVARVAQKPVENITVRQRRINPSSQGTRDSLVMLAETWGEDDDMSWPGPLTAVARDAGVHRTDVAAVSSEKIRQAPYVQAEKLSNQRQRLANELREQILNASDAQIRGYGRGLSKYFTRANPDWGRAWARTTATSRRPIRKTRRASKPRTRTMTIPFAGGRASHGPMYPTPK